MASSYFLNWTVSTEFRSRNRPSDREGRRSSTGNGACPWREGRYLIPQFLPDGEHFLYHHITVQGRVAVRAGSLGSKATDEVMPPELILSSTAGYAEPGYLLFSLNGTLMAQRFDTDTLQVAGTACPLVEQVRSTFSASNNRRLVYWQEPTSDGSSAATNRLTWFDRKGFTGRASLGEPSTYGSVALSRDERKVAVDMLTRKQSGSLYSGLAVARVND